MNPKISGIVDQISQLTLLETADLVQSLKVCETISESQARPRLSLRQQQMFGDPSKFHVSNADNSNLDPTEHP